MKKTNIPNQLKKCCFRCINLGSKGEWTGCCDMYCKCHKDTQGECEHKKALEKSGITPPEGYICRACQPSEKSSLKGERNRIIAQIREEERAKLEKEEVETRTWIREESVKLERAKFREMVSGIANWAGENHGASSTHLLQHMAGVEITHPYEPCDSDDRGRCIVLLRAVPEWIERLDEMAQYKGWAEQIPLIRQELSDIIEKMK